MSESKEDVGYVPVKSGIPDDPDDVIWHDGVSVGDWWMKDDVIVRVLVVEPRRIIYLRSEQSSHDYTVTTVVMAADRAGFLTRVKAHERLGGRRNVGSPPPIS